MKDFSLDHYERAFENWLIDNHIQYVLVDEQKRAAFGRSKLKSFDFLLYPSNQQVVIAEVKGRLFKGTSFEKLTGFECWVTTEDIEGLTAWQDVFGPGHLAVFVFAYKMENIDIDFDGRDVYDFRSDRYVFFAVKLGDYRKFMKRRSPKWSTVTLPADKFRECAVQMQNLLF
ncbi:MAG: HYExAFE family protein [Planctomycetota bacterium]